MSAQTPVSSDGKPVDSNKIDAASVILNLVAAGYRPAALIGDWFGYEAVIAPDISVRTMDPVDLFPTAENAPTSVAELTCEPGGRGTPHNSPWFFGVRPYSGPAFGGISRSVLVLNDGSWHAINVPADVQRHAFSGAREATAPTIAWDNGNESAHTRGVTACKEAIRAGEVYQACISTRFYGELTTDASLVASAHWFATKVREFSPARAAFIPGCPSQSVPTVASLSPEEFLIRNGGTVTETPIKGTLPITADPAELLASDKDVAENIMIVDLVRHDLGQIARTGGVRVTDLLSVRPAPGVWHLFSTVEADIPEALPHADVIEACFPPASVTGTPKLRAQELLATWEPVARGVHCGCIGASTGAQLELSVAIRTAEFYDDPATNIVRVEAGIGGGITIDSQPAQEWAEIQSKVAPLFE
ncbi:aminodeoxychorismate synthase component I [Corynebacterium sp. H113]|uniref:aminodeoxychorismate synthase component I n=1 Tax=Corynebacterium sp. H113 TaxID=3133419 RepID=UPI0030B5AFDD